MRRLPCLEALYHRDNLDRYPIGAYRAVLNLLTVGVVPTWRSDRLARSPIVHPARAQCQFSNIWASLELRNGIFARTTNTINVKLCQLEECLWRADRVPHKSRPVPRTLPQGPVAYSRIEPSTLIQGSFLGPSRGLIRSLYIYYILLIDINIYR